MDYEELHITLNIYEKIEHFFPQKKFILHHLNIQEVTSDILGAVFAIAVFIELVLPEGA